MKKPPMRFAPDQIALRTYLARQRVTKAIEMHRKLTEDPERAARIAQQVCIACHYFPAIAGAACTTRPCAACATEQTYSSTDTDAFCSPCAQKHGLCKHCGGDVNMNTRRNYPTAENNDVA